MENTTIKTWLERCLLLAIAAFSLFFAIERLAAVFNPDDRTTIQGWDDSFYFYWLRSVVIDGDVDFENEIQDNPTLTDELKTYALGLEKTPNGLVPNKYPVGWAVSSLPFFLPAHIVSIILDAAGLDVSTDGYGAIYQATLFLGHAFLALLSLFLAFAILRHYFPGSIAWRALILVWAASSLYCYQTRLLSMPHNLVFLYVCLSWLLVLSIEKNGASKSKLILLGLSAGLLIITRPQAGVYLVLPAVGILSLLQQKKLTLNSLLPSVAAFLPIVGIQLVAWKVLYGDWILYTYTNEGFNWLQPAIGPVLFSSFHGLFYFHPVMLIGLLGFLFAKNVSNWPLRSGILVIVLTIYINAAWSTWWYGSSFGNRAFEGLTLLSMMGVGFLLQRSASVRWLHVALVSVLALLVLWNLNLMVLTRYWKLSGITMDSPHTIFEMLQSSWEFYSGMLAIGTGPQSPV